MFTKEEIISLRRFCQEIIYQPLPFSHQEAVLNNGHSWCLDWWTIEILKCLFLGENTYRLDPPPRRLRNNPLFSIEEICTAAEAKRQMLLKLREQKDFSDTIVICEAGRGIDILVSSMVKKWEKYIVYDSNPHVIEKLSLYFKSKLGLPVESIVVPSDKFQLTEPRPIVVVVNNPRGIAEDKDFGSGCLFIRNGQIAGETTCSKN